LSAQTLHKFSISPCVPSEHGPRPEIISFYKKRELSGTEECEEGRRELAGRDSSLPVPPALFKIIYSNGTSY